MRYKDIVGFALFDFSGGRGVIKRVVRSEVLVIPFSNPPAVIPDEGNRAQSLTIYNEDKWNVYLSLDHYRQVKSLLIRPDEVDGSRYAVDILSLQNEINPFKKFVNYAPLNPFALIDSISIYDKIVHMVKTIRGDEF